MTKFFFATLFLFSPVFLTSVHDADASEVVFHDWRADKALHLGDNDGKISDIEDHIAGLAAISGNDPNDVAYFAGNSKEWRFSIENPPASGTLQLEIFSLQQRGDYDCRTALEVNGESFDLRDVNGANVGYKKHTRASISTPLQKENVVRILEETCAGGGRNDSLFLRGAVTFGNVSTETAVMPTNVLGNYKGVYAFCKNTYPCDEAAMERSRSKKKNDIAVKLWEEDGELKVRFSPPHNWSKFGSASDAHFVAVAGNTVHFKVDGENGRTVEFKGVVEDTSLSGVILYNNYIMDGRLTRK
ncbi:MAG: hypothetical protein WD509_02995 [Candidatus Paceibacterota bacterium]